jgi:hypothetical protein
LLQAIRLSSKKSKVPGRMSVFSMLYAFCCTGPQPIRGLLHAGLCKSCAQTWPWLGCLALRIRIQISSCVYSKAVYLRRLVLSVPSLQPDQAAEPTEGTSEWALAAAKLGNFLEAHVPAALASSQLDLPLQQLRGDLPVCPTGSETLCLCQGKDRIALSFSAFLLVCAVLGVWCLELCLVTQAVQRPFNLQVEGLLASIKVSVPKE